MYNRPLHNGNWTSTASLGRTAILSRQFDFIKTAMPLESTVRFRTRELQPLDAHSKMSTVPNELILGENPLPPKFSRQPIGRVQASPSDTNRDIDLIPRTVANGPGSASERFMYGVCNVFEAM